MSSEARKELPDYSLSDKDEYGDRFDGKIGNSKKAVGFTPGEWMIGGPMTGPRTPSTAGVTVDEYLHKCDGEYEFRNSVAVTRGRECVGIGIGDTLDEARANARLFAAAPKLLEALIMAQKFIAKVDALHQTIYWPQLDDECLAAIAKATTP